MKKSPYLETGSYTIDRMGIVRDKKSGMIVTALSANTTRNRIRFRWRMFVKWLGELGAAAAYAIQR